MSSDSTEPRKIKKSLSKGIVVLFGIIVLLLIGVSTYFFLQYQSTRGQQSENTDNEEVEEITEKVGKLYELPTGEAVTLATVSDVTKLKDQAFFDRAQNGDKVLIYTQAGKAILYRPSINKIIEVGPVSSADQRSEEAVSQPVRVAIYNGTSVNGLTRRAEAALLQMSSLQIDVVALETASRSAYSNSVVVDLNGTHGQEAKQLATFARGTVGTLPQGEEAPEDADILIILGSSYVEE